MLEQVQNEKQALDFETKEILVQKNEEIEELHVKLKQVAKQKQALVEDNYNVFEVEEIVGRCLVSQRRSR